MITKEECKEFALKHKQDTGKFPISSDWATNKNFPCTYYILNKMIKSYNDFREYCGEPNSIRSSLHEVSITWMKSMCLIDDNNCWNWNKAIHYKNGYGYLGLKGKTVLSHRLSYELANGKIPEGLLIRHKCNNRKCCNPEHLELGTPSENALDIKNRKTSSNNIETAIKVRYMKTIEERLKYYIDNSNVTENCCIECNILTKRPTGYYQISYKNRFYLLHRLILANKLNKKYDDIIMARHSCRNVNCINSDHLEEGTMKENSLDSRKFSKNTKLTEDKVRLVKIDLQSTSFHEKGSKFKFDLKWATEFNVGKDCISDIRLGNTWSDIQI
jgi:hypothetical protein